MPTCGNISLGYTLCAKSGLKYLMREQLLGDLVIEVDYIHSCVPPGFGQGIVSGRT